MPGESVHYAFVNCLSLDRHTTATEYEELCSFVKLIGYYFAVKAEDTVTTDFYIPDFEEAYKMTPGKTHVHWLTVCEFATHAHNTNDLRYGAKRKSRYRELVLKHCPAIAAALSNSKHARQFAFMTAQMTSDHAAVYFSKETVLQMTNLPPDLVVLRPYISIKKARQPNVERDAHVEAYTRSGRPMPPTAQDITDYFNYRWFVANDLKTPSMPVHRENIIESVYLVMGPQGVPVPKRLRAADTETPDVAKPVAKRFCPKCSENMSAFHLELQGGPNVLGKHRKICDECNAHMKQ